METSASLSMATCVLLVPSVQLHWAGVQKATCEHFTFRGEWWASRRSLEDTVLHTGLTTLEAQLAFFKLCGGSLRVLPLFTSS